MTKRTFLALAAVTGLLASHSPARAADDTTAAPQRPADRFTALRERMLETAKELNLTAEQKEKLQKIVRDRFEKLRELRQDPNLTAEQKRAKFQTAREEIVAEVKKILTPEQFEKWKSHQGLSEQSPLRPKERIQEAIQDLNLTDAQKEQLRPLYEEQMEKLRELHQDSSLSMSKKLDKLRAIHKEAAPKLKKVMTPEQFAKWEKDVNQWLDDLKARFVRGKEQ